METNKNIQEILKKSSDSYLTLISLIIFVIISYLLLYFLVPNGFTNQLGYSILLTLLLSIVIVTLFRLYTVVSLNSDILKLLYIFGGISIIGLGIYGILYYLGLFVGPPRANRFDLLFNYLAILFIIVISYFIFIKKINVNTIGLTSQLQQLHNYRLLYTIILVIFLLGVIALYLYNPNKIMTKFGGTTNFIIILVLLFIAFILFATIKSYDYFLNNPLKLTSDLSTFSFFKYIYILFAFILSGIFIYGILYYLGIFNQESSTQYGSILVNILLLATMIGILYKLFNVGGYLQKHPLYNLIINTILYIPCLLVSLIRIVKNIFSPSELTKETINKKNDFIFLSISLLLLSGYFIIYNYGIPFFRNKYYKQGGILLVDKPINIEKLHNIQLPFSRIPLPLTYKSKYTLHNYNYAFSFWFYLDSFPPSTNNSYLKTNNILSFNNHIFIKYDPPSNSLIIDVPNNKLDITNQTELNNKTEISDENINEKWLENKNKIKDITNKIKTKNIFNEIDNDDNRIVYKNKNILLQKWNNIIINFNGGTLDIFYNGKLVKSAIEVVSYIKYDSIIIGNENGISGSLCNLLYFNTPLDILTINTLYNSLQDSNPPIISNKKEVSI
jgi:hypothetical protein